MVYSSTSFAEARVFWRLGALATGVPEGVALMFWGHVLKSLGSFGLEGLSLRENGTPTPGHLFVIADLRRLDANALPCRKGLPHKENHCNLRDCLEILSSEVRHVFQAPDR